MTFSTVSRRSRCALVACFLAAAALAAPLLGCGSSPPKEASTATATPSAASAKPSDSPAAATASSKPEEPHCFLGESEANEYAHDLMIAVLSSSKFNQKKVTRATTPENLKVLESSLRQKMFQLSCKKPFKDDVETVEGALLVLAMMNLDDGQWTAAQALVATPVSYRALPSEVQDWLKDGASLDSIKSLSRAQVQNLNDLLGAAAKELKCGKDAVSVKVKSIKSAEVEGCKRNAVMKNDGGWKREGS